jgi:hypothetical protein
MTPCPITRLIITPNRCRLICPSNLRRRGNGASKTHSMGAVGHFSKCIVLHDTVRISRRLFAYRYWSVSADADVAANDSSEALGKSCYTAIQITPGLKIKLRDILINTIPLPQCSQLVAGHLFVPSPLSSAWEYYRNPSPAPVAAARSSL